MMKSLLFFGVAAAALASPIAAQAPQQPKPVTRAQFEAKLNADFAAIDANHDGVLSVAEVQAAQARDLEKVKAGARARLEAEFKRLDTNRDGHLSVQEFQAMAVVHPNSTPEQIVQQFDSNQDGKVTAAEFKNPRLQQFERADANHDGVVTPAEMQAAMQHK